MYFPGGPVVKTSLSDAAGMGLILSWGAKTHLLRDKQSKHKQKQCNKLNKDLIFFLSIRNRRNSLVKSESL